MRTETHVLGVGCGDVEEPRVRELLEWTCVDAAAALDAIEARDAACVVAATPLPSRSPAEFTAAVRDRCPDTPVVVYGQADGAETVASVQAAGGSYVHRDGTSRQAEVLVNRVLDLAERERRERALDELHDATRRLVRAREKDRIADRATDAAEEILGFTLNGVRFYDEAADVLRPASMTEDVTEAAGDRPVYERGEAVHWRVFESGEPLVFEDVSDIDDDQHRSGSGGVMYYPLGEHGVLSIGREGERGFSELDRQFARLLVANTRAALDLADRARELERREAELARRNDHLEEFTSTVCHDLRNPLNIAMGGVTLARDAVDETPAERLDRALDALDRMESLLEHSHDLAQQGQAVAGDELERVNPAAVAEQAWRTVDTGAASLDAGPAGTVQADPERLRTLFENLFRNAVEHGGDDVTVTVAPLNDRQRADGGFDESWQGFRVADDGDGIPSAVRESVFARGYTTDDDGTGFGLATVRTIAESHGWDIDVTDSDAGGACFEIRV